MKILFIRKQYNFVGGAERYLESLIGELVERRIDVHLLCLEWAGSHPPDLRIHHLKNKRPFHFWENVVFARQAADFVRRGYQFDIIFSLERTYLQDIYRAGDGVHRVWLERKRQFSSPFGTVGMSFNPLHLTTCALERQTFNPDNTAHVIANSMMVKKEIVQYTKFPENRIAVIPNGVDISKFSPVNPAQKAIIRKKLGLPDEKFIFLLVGSGFFRKGVRFAIDFVKRLRRPDVMLLVIGRGELPHGADPRYVRHKTNVASVNEAYRAADALLLPTLYDPFANVTLEAMASGLPVITSAYNGASDFVADGQEGWIWRDLRDTDSMVDRVQPIFGRDIWESMSVLARAKAEKLTLERNVDATLDFIRRVAATRM